MFQRENCDADFGAPLSTTNPVQKRQQDKSMDE